MDDSKQFDAHAIMANPGAYAFNPANPALSSLSLGYYQGAVWLRFNRHVADAQKLWLVFEPTFVDDIRLYQLSPDGNLSEQRTGDHVPFSQRPVLARKMVLPLNLSPGDNNFLLRVETRSAFTLSAQLWQAEPFLIGQQAETLFYGVLFGLITLALLASILCAFWTRQGFFWIVTGYLLCFGLLQIALNGFDQPFYPNNLYWPNNALGITNCITSVFLVLFVTQYLRLQVHLPRWYLGAHLCLYCSIIFLIISLAGFYAGIVKFFMMYSLVLLLSIAVVSFRMLSYEPQRARLLLITFLPSIAAVILQAIRNLGGLPLNFWTTHIWAISAIFQVSFTLLVVLLKLREDEIEMEQQKEHSQALRHFYNLMAHELRTPLSVIDTAIANMQLQLEPELPTLQPRFRRIQTAVARLNNMVDNALAEDRLNQLDMPLNIEPIQVVDLISEVKSLALLTDRHQLNSDTSDLDIIFQADRQWLVLALLNLLDNAVKYSPKGGPILLRVTADTQQLTFSVIDEGLGVPPEKSEHLFKRFYRINNHPEAQRVPGLGLGLYLVALVAERHRGKAAYQSLAAGSCFSLQLPL